jgi:hypothetical protein
MATEHRLRGYECGVQPGYNAVCSCGWKSGWVSSIESAECELQIHVREMKREERIAARLAELRAGRAVL